MNEIELINTAHADPEVRGLRLKSSRGGDESRRPPVVAAGGRAKLMFALREGVFGGRRS